MESSDTVWTHIAATEDTLPGLEFVYSKTSRSVHDPQYSYARSIGESRVSRIYHPKDGSIVIERLVTLADFVSLLARSNVRGPWHLTEPNLQSRGTLLARGGQWDVFTDATGIMDTQVIKRSRTLDLNTILSEIRTLSHPVIRSHANIIQLHSWGFDHPNHEAKSIVPIMFIERALASVQGLLNQRSYSIEVKQQLCLGTAEGLACLHLCGIVHADLNPKNVLVVPQDNPDVPFIAKVSDFGSSIDISNGASYSYRDYLATPGWTPPEVDLDPDTLRPGAELLKCDSWAFGMFLFSVLYKNGQTRPLNIDEEAPLVPESLSKKLNEDCRLLIAPDPSCRPNVSSHLLDDNSRPFIHWLHAKSANLTVQAKSGPEYEYNFWAHIDTDTLSRLNLEYRALGRLKSISRLPHGQVLFGMALGYLQNTYPSLGLEYLQAAARAESNPAKGAVFRLACATRQLRLLSAADEEELECQRESWLFDAASSGSLVAASDLQSISTSQYEAAWDLFRRRGGYQIIPGMDAMAWSKDCRTGPRSPTDGGMELYAACTRGNYTEVIRNLASSGRASITSKPFEIGCLHWLFMFKSSHIEDVAKRLLSAGAQLEARTATIMEGKARRHIPNEHFPFHWPIGTPLHWACFARSSTAISVLLELGADVDALDDDNDIQAQTPLAMAMYRGDSNIVQLLLDHGADSRRVDGVGRSPLHMLALDDGQNRLLRLRKTMMWRCYHGEEANHLREVRRCVAAVALAGGDLEHKRRNGQTAMQDALETKDGGVVMALIEAGANVRCRFAYSNMLPALYWLRWVNARTLAYPNLFLPVLKVLLSKSNDLAMEDSEGTNLFHGLVLGAPTSLEDHIFGDFATLYHYMKGAAELLKASHFAATVDSRDLDGQTPLILALSCDGGFTKELADLLLVCGASISHALDERQELIWTICNNDTLGDLPCRELVQVFSKDLSEASRRTLFTMKDLPNVNRRRRSALQRSIGNGYLQTLTWMLGLGHLDINQLSGEGHTPLDTALGKADILRVSALERWDHHATTAPKSRRASDYDELFWTPKWNPNIASYKLMNGDFEYEKERYFAAPEIVHLLLQHGAKEGRHFTSVQDEIKRPRHSDREFAEYFGFGESFIAEQQPYYDMWKILYDIEAEAGLGNFKYIVWRLVIISLTGLRVADSEHLKDRLDQELQIGIKHRNRYFAAAVLALYWEAAEEGYRKEATDIVNFFREKLHYNAETFPIPSDNSHKALSNCINNFILCHDAEENLLVIHYGGHGDENSKRKTDDERRSVWAAFSKEGPTLNWYDIQQQFNYAEGDVLMLLDCCHSSQSARDVIKFELLAGCAMKRETLPPGPYSFTTTLLREMDELLARHNEVMIVELYHRLIRRRAGLSETPIYVPSNRRRACEGVCLSPIDPDNSLFQTGLESADLYSLWLKIQVEGSVVDDVTMFRELSNYLRRGLPKLVVGMSVEKVISRAEGLCTIASHNDRMMDGEPLVQAMDSTSRLHISKLWHRTHTILLEGSSLWIAGCLHKAQTSAILLRERLSSLVQKIHAQNETLTEAIAQGASHIPALDKSMLNDLEHDALANSLGLAEIFRLQRLVRYFDKSNDPLQVDPDTVQPIDKSIWQMDGEGELVIVERKLYEKLDTAQQVDRAKERIQKLANLLAIEKSEGFRSLACIHWFHDDYHHFFGLVFSIPISYRHNALSLLELINTWSKVALEQRFKMAISLCHGLQKWHSANWLHKGIRSDNVLIFQHKDSKCWDFGNPFLGGQEYARPDSEISSARFVDNFKENVYRHPARQGLPRESHTKIHDIYSLGVVLLEIGLWQPVTQFREFYDGTARLTPEHMSKIVVSNAENRLHHFMGSGYKNAVIKCLVGGLRAEIDDIRLASQLAQNFKTMVIQSIADGIITDTSAE